MTESFDDFLERREAAARAYVAGNPDPVLDLSTRAGPATFFDPGGGFTEGADAVNRANRDGARQFGTGGTTSFEIHDSGASGDLAYWTGYQRANVEMDGKTVPMTLRITEMFRREDGEWRMVHRHASLAKDT